jgi:hypothetical protein
MDSTHSPSGTLSVMKILPDALRPDLKSIPQVI